MARVLLVDPRGWQGGVESDNVFPNLGLAYLVAALSAKGHEVLIADMNNESLSDQDVADLVVNDRIQIVGISIKTATMEAARRLGTFLKQETDCLVIVGGPHATMAGDQLAREEWVDNVFQGEAEEGLPAFCESAQRGTDRLPTVNSEGAPPCFITNLDLLPFPDFSLFPQQVQAAVAQNYPLVTSRGCVFDCTYCSVPIVSGKRFRKRAPENILGELEQAIKRYCIREFCIIDDAFNLDMGRAKEFCRLLVERNLGLRWSCPNGLRADRVDDELAELMSASGCYSVMLGVESGDPEVFSSIGKGETLEQVSTGIRTFQRAGMQVGGYFLIGLPGDSLESQYRSVEFARDHGLVAHFNMLIPYPGTCLWEWAKSNANMLRDIEQGLHFADSGGKVLPVFETAAFTEVQRMEAYRMVHTRMARFEMLLPATLKGWKRRMTIIALILRYDRPRVGRALKMVLSKDEDAKR